MMKKQNKLFLDLLLYNMKDLITLEYYNQSLKQKEVLHFSPSLLKGKPRISSLFVIKLDGESMQDLIQDKSLLVASLDVDTLSDGCLYLLDYENALWLKKAKRIKNTFVFVSINKKFSHLVFKEEEIRVVAKVVASFTSYS